MANPNPQHNPTDGLDVAAYVHVTGTGITNTSGGANKTQGSSASTNPYGGQGIGAGTSASGTKPVAQYALQLSLAAAGGLAATCQLTVVLKDVINATYSTSNTANIKYKSYNNPDAGTPTWYNPDNYGSYTADIASVSSSGLITALAVGQAIIEVQFPTFDDVMTPQTDSNTGNPTMMISCQIIVTVKP